MATAPDRAQRYDRGIRVWGAHGQEALEAARVCLLNAGPTGTEALKNMVLGGIHSFTIVDGAKVEPADLGNNFLLTADGVSAPRAQCATECLKELNESVAGSYVEETPRSLMNSNPDFFKQFTLVIATQLGEADAVTIDNICRQHGVRLLLLRSYGLLGYVRPSVPEQCVVESKPDSKVDDLRLGNPWPELAAYAASVELAGMEDVAHSHVPYAALLIKAAKQWAESHGGGMPGTYTERSAFKDLLRGWQRHIDGFPLEEENLTEAVSNAHKVWAPPTVGSDLRAVLQDAAAASITRQSPNFWVLVAALNRFIAQEGQGQLPLEGSIPDMHASTQAYLDLQRIYHAKAEADAAAVEAHARALLEAAGRDPASLPASEVRHFCKHARYLRIVRCRSLEEETEPDSCRGEALRGALAAEDTAANAALYLLLRAADRFHATYQRYPGTFDSELEEDAALLKSQANAILSECGAAGGGGGSSAPAGVSDDLVGEMCRCAAGELHVVAAVVGAIAAQEAIKLLTGQFVPVGGALIYNAMQCTTSVFAF
ncbi:NEDD8-activating enzyme E1 regulatory subunit [Micractinium conductrix]|uniref:NEDD8-activating enzyme E1 regulatory subunit n=1 Tax=Micractinium conductrix TaxID=554055 RepID=A0A2P6V472_9CHLO|nr:NEDD8-activating enzyme E1 regulatory subunit [Micractinium conductrix]|eukprot:PSC68884.1 NEDD8-activating enzyme E1 regulatory subunit [Micractinium conductrix]